MNVLGSGIVSNNIYPAIIAKIIYEYSNKDTIDHKVDSLLSKMTLKEKVGQMTQINLTVIAKGPNKWGSTFPLEIDHDRAIKALVDYKVGSILNTHEVLVINGNANTPKVQDFCGIFCPIHNEDIVGIVTSLNFRERSSIVQ